MSQETRDLPASTSNHTTSRYEETPKAAPIDIDSKEVTSPIASMSLIPGLVTKPPLPKKPEAAKLPAPKVKPNSVAVSEDLGAGDGCHINREYENLSSIHSDDSSDNYDMIQATVLEKIEEEEQNELFSSNLSQDDFFKIADETCDLFSDSFDQSEVSTSARRSKSSDKTVHFQTTEEDPKVKLQNWVQEDDSLASKPEINTDLALHNLRAQHSKRAEADETTKQKMNQVKADTQKKKVDLNASKRFAKFEQKRPKAFTATPLKTPPDYTPHHPEHDVESWMSSIEKKPTPKRKTSYRTSPKPKSKPVNYLDFLNNIDELEVSLSDLFFDGIKPDAAKVSKQDYTEAEDSGSTYDEIVSILQELENEGKKSRKSSF